MRKVFGSSQSAAAFKVILKVVKSVKGNSLLQLQAIYVLE